MKIDIKARDLSITDSILNYLDDQLYYRLGGRFEQIRKLSVSLSHDRQSADKTHKRCKIRISLPRLKDIVIEDSQPDIYVAIFRALDKASKKLFLRLSRFESKNRKFYVPNKSRPLLVMAS
jgi:putative sigma-54 modulation protein